MREKRARKLSPYLLFSRLVVFLDKERADSGALVARQAFETAIDAICQLVKQMIVPSRYRILLVAQFEAAHLCTDSRVVRQSLADLIDHLKRKRSAGRVRQ